VDSILAVRVESIQKLSIRGILLDGLLQSQHGFFRFHPVEPAAKGLIPGGVPAEKQFLPPGPGFRDIELNDKIDVYVKQGPNFEVKVEAGKNMHIGITTEVKDSVLIINNVNTFNFVRSPKRKVKVFITSPHFKKFINNTPHKHIFF